DEDGACAAHADPAGLAHARQTELPTQHLKQRLVGARLHLVLGAVDVQGEPHARASTRSSAASSTRSGVSGRWVTGIPSDATAFPIAGGTGGRAVSPSPWISAPSRSRRSCVSRVGRSAHEGTG